MPHEPSTVSAGYPLDRLRRAVRAATDAGDADARRRAEEQTTAWLAVLDGMADGTLAIGSRAPIADVPAWVTPRVAHGGFATGLLAAEAALDADEQALVGSLPAGSPGTTDRGRLNTWALGDAGQAELVAALADGSYRVELPEDAALPVVAWLLDRGHDRAAVELARELWPFLDRLRMTPRREPAAAITPGSVRLVPVGEVRALLARREPPPQVVAMNETLRRWHPLYDRLVALWCDTVDGELPTLDGDTVVGGSPGHRLPPDWSARRAALLADRDAAASAGTPPTRWRSPRRGPGLLLDALRRCEHDTSALTARDIGSIRRALAATITKRGAPGSESRTALRAAQAHEAARPTHAALAHVLAERLRSLPADGGIPDVEPLVVPVADGETAVAPAGHPIPGHLAARLDRAIEAPVAELIDRGVISSGELLAAVLPQLTSHVAAAGLDDPDLRALCARTYGAFRRRRSLLLLDLQHQVRFDELPWIVALEPLRVRRAADEDVARDAMRQATLLALTAFPHTVLPNPLVSELASLARRAGSSIPLVEEVAADIFTGRFTAKWRAAAIVASELLAGAVYARYYDLPPAATLADEEPEPRTRWGAARRGDAGFSRLCAERAREAWATTRGRRSVAANGAVLEQSQILTTHNLAALIDGLALHDEARAIAPELADRALAWAMRRLAGLPPQRHAALPAIKNAAYAWRQGIFFLSLCDEPRRRVALDRLHDVIAERDVRARVAPVVDGLAFVLAGGRFATDGSTAGGGGRRFLGWSVGPHPLLDG